VRDKRHDHEGNILQEGVIVSQCIRHREELPACYPYKLLLVNDALFSQNPQNTESVVKCVICTDMPSRVGYADARSYPMDIDLNMAQMVGPCLDKGSHGDHE
jgi:hypothetical protein